MNILVADDELLIRQSVMRMLQQMPEATCMDAEDGIDALEKIIQFKPDLIIADIRMPGMNGLELLAEAKRRGLPDVFVFLSGYDLFDYARQAIQLGGLGYLLKPVKEEELLEVVRMASERLALQRTERHAFLQMEREARRGQTAIRKQFLQQLMRQEDMQETYIQAKLIECGIMQLYHQFVVMFLSIDGFSQQHAMLSAKEQELYLYALENIATEIVRQDRDVAVYACNYEDGIVMLINYGEESSLLKRQAMIAKANQIRSKVELLMPFRITIGIGDRFDNIAGCAQSCAMAAKAVRQRLARGGNSVYDSQVLPDGAIRQQTVSVSEERDFLLAAERKNYNQMIEFVCDKYAVFQEAVAMYDTEPLLKLNFQVVMLIARTLQRIGKSPDEKLGDELKLYHELNSYSSISDIIGRLKTIIVVCFEENDRPANDKEDKWVQKALEYVHMNFSDDLTLTSVAERVHLSPNYLSRLFKEETGRSFSDYLLDFRMERARSLLQEGVYKANQVAAMVGFHNEKYFYRVFKKVTGFSPGEYRKL